MASERTILLTQLDPTGLDGGKERENRERKERGEEEEDFRGFSPTWFSSYIRTVQMVGVFGAGKAVCFGTESWKFWTVSDSPGWVWRLPSGGPDCVFMMI